MRKVALWGSSRELVAIELPDPDGAFQPQIEVGDSPRRAGAEAWRLPLA